MKKKITKWTFAIFTLMLFLLTAYVMIFASRAFAKNELFHLFGYAYSVVPTDSMEGSNSNTVKKGDIVFIDRTPYEDLEVGDIIVFKSDEGRLIIHRIHSYDKSSGEIITHGDKNPDDYDQPITEYNYRGKFVSKLSLLNLGLIIYQHRTLLFGFVMLLLAITIIIEVVSIFKQVNERNKQKIKAELEEREKQEKQKLYDEIKAEEAQKNKV
ncbi:MAG: signal peptidase I [Acholeplasmataceae bacterium]